MSRPARTIRGTGVSPGVAWAPAFIMRNDFPSVPDRGVPPAQVDQEVTRLRAAADQVAEELRELGERVLKRAGPEESRIFDAQIMMVQDPTFLESVESLIRSSHLSAETAYEFKALELRNAWSGVGSAHIRERLADLTAIQLRMLHKLMDRDGELFTVPTGEPVIVVAHELAPGLTVQLDREQVVGLISEEGTRTSHAAILAHSLGIPCVMGAMGALSTIPDGATVLMDGSSGVVTVEPTRDELEDARARLSRRHRLELQLESVLDQPAISPDGRRITLLSNVDLPDELEAALRNGAEGVGLLRTEFLLTGRTALPTEDEQADYFRRVARAFAGKPVVIRSYDLGGDKFPASFQTAPEANPFLGWRSIRVCLDQPDVFRAQLRALLRVAADADVRLMLPLIISVDEVTRSRELVQEEAADLARLGVRAAPTLPIGVMIETPSAVIIADQLAQVSDFFSVGTNDLTQYTLALDRGNARLADRFSSHHPAVVRSLATLAAAGRKANVPISICGEMATDPVGAVLLTGLGFDTLSVAPPALPLIKWILRTVPASATVDAANDALLAPSAEAVTAVVRARMAPHVDARLFPG